MSKTAIFATLTALVVMFGVSASDSKAAEPGFSRHYIISDDEFTDYAGMSAEKIQQFLDTKTGPLKTYVHTDGRTAAQVIFDAAQANRISPKVLLVTIHKESSMITRTTFPSGLQYYLDWIVFYGWCDSCSTGSNKGFANQINAAAAAYRRYLDLIAERGFSISGWGPGITKTIQCIDSDYDNGRELCTPGTNINIIPANGATSALYTYTPHPGGNYAFWYHWNNFGFNLRRYYPDGTLLRAQGGSSVYIVEGGLLRRFANSGAFLSRHSFNRVITVPADHLLVYDQGQEIKYANYSLLKSPSGGIYLLADDVKRPIAGMKVFKNAGWSREEVVKASWDDLNIYPEGAPVTMDDIFPSGQLLRNKKTGSMWYVKDGTRYGIFNKEIYKSQFGNRKLIAVAPAEIEKYPKGPMIGFKDGELITSKKNGGTAYVISGGQRLPIASAAAFLAYRFSWSNLLRVDDRAIEIHPIGPTLDVDSLVKTASR